MMSAWTDAATSLEAILDVTVDEVGALGDRAALLERNVEGLLSFAERSSVDISDLRRVVADVLAQLAAVEARVAALELVIPPASPPPTEIKWNPGHGVLMNGIVDAFDTSAYTAAKLDDVRTVTDKVMIRFYWGALEPTRDAYNMQPIRDALELCKARSLRLCASIHTTATGGTALNYYIDQGRLPAYIRDDYQSLIGGPTGGYYISAENVAVRWDIAELTDRRIALHKAIAAEFDSEPMFDGVSTVETATHASQAADFSEVNYLTELKRLVTALRAAYKTTNVFFKCNHAFQQNVAMVQELEQHMADNRMVLSGPDIAPDDWLNGFGGSLFQDVYRGTFGTKDFRGLMASAAEIQSPNLGGNHTPPATQLPPEQLFNYIASVARNELRMSYVWWLYKTGTSGADGTNDIYWNTGPQPTIKQGIASNPPLVIAKPANYL